MGEWKWRSESRGRVGRAMEKGWKVGSGGEGKKRGRKWKAKDGRGKEEGGKRTCEVPTITVHATACCM